LEAVTGVQTCALPILGLMGIISSEMRLPMCPMPKDLTEKLRGILKQYGLVKS